MRLAALRAKSELRALLPFGRALYREQALAIFRLAAALSFIVLFPYFRSQAGDYSSALDIILFAYALASLVILVRVFVVSKASMAFLAFVHISDLVWPSLICLFTGCDSSPFLFLFIFALLASPYRRKWMQTLLVALCAALIIFIESFLASMPGLDSLHLMHSPMQAGPIAMKGALLLIVAGVLSYSLFWSEREQQAYAARSVLRRLRSDASIQANLREVLPAILDVFEARRAILVLRSSSAGRVFQWVANSGERESMRGQSIRYSDEEWYWPLPESIWSVVCSRKASKCNYLALNRHGYRLPMSPASLHPGSLLSEPFQSLLATNLDFGSEWTGQLFLIDAPCAAGQESCLRLLQQLGNEVGPATYNFYLWRHKSVHIRAIERQRLARDLHDGVVQSLIATEVQLELLKRRFHRADEHNFSLEPLLDVQNLLRSEVRKLRNQIDQLRSSSSSGPFLPRLTEMVEGFQRETGILTRFSCDIAEGSIPHRISSEVLHIVEEALSNIRRHSGAHKVDVRMTDQDNAWEIVVQDDGCGFDFSGRLSLSQLDAARKGPRVIRERVHSAKGDLVLESYPNRGARLKIRLAANH